MQSTASLEQALIALLVARVPLGSEVIGSTKLAALDLSSIDAIEIAFEVEELIGRQMNISLDDLLGRRNGDHDVQWLVRELAEEQQGHNPS